MSREGQPEQMEPDFDRAWKDDKEHRRNKGEALQMLKALDASDDNQRVRTKQIERDLEDIMDELKEVGKAHKDDPDLLHLVALYVDLQNDFNEGRELELDMGFEVSVDIMNEFLEESGVQRYEMDSLPSSSEFEEVNGAVARLEEAGMAPSYVVRSGNPDARPVVLILQSHVGARGGGDPEMQELSAAVGVDASQREIADGLRNGAADVVFYEGIPMGKLPFSPDQVAALKGDPEKWDQLMESEQVGIELAGRGDLTFRGLERFRDNDTETRKYKEYRTSAGNIFMASTVAQGLDATPADQLAAVVMGANHEVDFLGVKPGLPLANALAGYGMDVIVIDASTKHMDTHAVEQIALRRARG